MNILKPGPIERQADSDSVQHEGELKQGQPKKIDPPLQKSPSEATPGSSFCDLNAILKPKHYSSILPVIAFQILSAKILCFKKMAQKIGRLLKLGK